MKSFITLLIFLYITVSSYAQNKNLSIGFNLGKTSFIDNIPQKNGSVFSTKVNYIFLKDKRVNITTGILFTRYRVARKFNEPVYCPNGVLKGISPITIVTTDKYIGFEISSQIKLLKLDNKLAPYLGTNLSYQREIFRESGSQTAYNAMNLSFLAGITYNKRVQISLYYDALISDANLKPFSTGFSTVGFELNYLFNLNFSK